MCYKWSGTALHLLSTEFGLDLVEPEYWEHIQDQVTPEQWSWLWDEGVEQGLFRHGGAYPGTFAALDELSALGDITIITHRPQCAVSDTLDWIAFHKIVAPTIHILYREEKKSSVQPFCDIYVDDKVSNCVDLVENTPGLVCLWDRPANKAQQRGLRGDIHIIDTWEQFIELAQDVAEGKSCQVQSSAV